MRMFRVKMVGRTLQFVSKKKKKKRFFLEMRTTNFLLMIFMAHYSRVVSAFVLGSHLQHSALQPLAILRFCASYTLTCCVLSSLANTCLSLHLPCLAPAVSAACAFSSSISLSYIFMCVCVYVLRCAFMNTFFIYYPYIAEGVREGRKARYRWPRALGRRDP